MIQNILSNRDINVISIGCPCKIIFKKEYNTIINLHGGLTPWQKGKFSPIKSMAKENSYLGATLHEIEEEFDSGKVLSQKHIKNTFTNEVEAYIAILNIASRLLDQYFEGKVYILPKHVINKMKKF